MSPAPVRQLPSTQRFPHRWGYFAGAILILVGIGVAIWGAVSGVTGFADDVRDLRRVIGGDGAVELNLDRGEEVLVYDETDVGIGPFDVRVIRTSDNAVVPTEDIFGGTTYDVDGNSGRARVGFQVPSSDIYRVELDTSVGQIARFAVGGDVGNNRANTVIAGLVWGGILVGVGFLVMVFTMILHARWRVRDAVLGQVSQARAAVERTADAAGPEARSARAGDAAEQAAGWARERLDAARSRLETSESADNRPPWQRRLTERAREGLDQADAALQSVEPAVADAAADPNVSEDLIGRVGDALQRIEERVSAGESLRDIAREERVVAEETARELASRAESARQSATERIDATTAAVEGAVSEQLAQTTAELSDIASTALDDVTQQSTAAFDDVTRQATTALGDVTESATVAGDDLAAGLAATAGAAGVAAAGAVTERARNLAEGSPASDLPAPPTSSLPAPPSVPTPPVPPTPPAAPVTPTTDREPRSAPPVVGTAAEAPPASAEDPGFHDDAEPVERSQPVDQTEPRAETVVDGAPAADPLDLSPPTAAPGLAPPPAAQALALGTRAATRTEPGADELVRPAVPVDSFRSLRPPPASVGILAQAPAAQGRPIGAAAEPRVSGPGGATTLDEGASDGPDDPAAPGTGDATDSVDGPGAPGTGDATDSVDDREAPGTGGGADGFSLAPPPDYGSLTYS